MNFSFNSSISVSSDGGLVIKNGNQTIRMGGNGMVINNQGSQQIIMNNNGIQIRNNGANISVNSRGFNGNININTNFTANEYDEDYWDSEDQIEGNDGFSSDSSFDEGNSHQNYYQNYETHYQINNGNVTYQQHSHNYNVQAPHTQYQGPQEEEEEPPRRQFLTKSEINQLPLSVYNAKKSTASKATTSIKGSTKKPAPPVNDDPSSNDSCAICIVDYKHGDKLRTLPCMHKFHKECIDKWLLVKSECCLCKYDLLE
jgi:hypothetical protein